jgi:hypothetical protein
MSRTQAGHKAGVVTAPPVLSDAEAMRPQWDILYRDCKGSEASVFDCSQAFLEDPNFDIYNDHTYCDHNEDISVACGNPVDPGAPQRHVVPYCGAVACGNPVDASAPHRHVVPHCGLLCRQGSPSAAEHSCTWKSFNAQHTCTRSSCDIMYMTAQYHGRCQLLAACMCPRTDVCTFHSHEIRLSSQLAQIETPENVPGLAPFLFFGVGGVNDDVFPVHRPQEHTA